MQEEIFTEEQLEENTKRIKKLYELISSGDAILMVGAGCSASIYPDWDAFVEKLDHAAKARDNSFNEKRMTS